MRAAVALCGTVSPRVGGWRSQAGWRSQPPLIAEGESGADVWPGSLTEKWLQRQWPATANKPILCFVFSLWLFFIGPVLVHSSLFLVHIMILSLFLLPPPPHPPPLHTHTLFSFSFFLYQYLHQSQSVHSANIRVPRRSFHCPMLLNNKSS